MVNIKEISSFELPGLDVYARLGERELLKYYEPHGGLFIAESPKVISRALDAEYEPVSMLVEKAMLRGETEDLVRRISEAVPPAQDFPVFAADESVLRQLTGFALTRGVLCAMKRKPLPQLYELCRNSHRIAVLENVTNPTNVGAIFRSAAAMGIEAVLLTSDSADPLYRRAVRVSMGTVFRIPWTMIDKDLCWTGELKKLGYTTCAMALEDDARSIDDPSLKEASRLAVVLGTEGDGLAAATISECDYQVIIPMAEGVDSLNVAAASAVAFWELGGHRKRRLI